MNFKDSFYTGSSKRIHGKRLIKLDPNIPKCYDQFVEKKGAVTHTYILCNKTIQGTIKCDFCVRRDVYIKDPAKFDSHKCISMQIERFFGREQNQDVQQSELTIKIIDFFGQNKLALNIFTSETFKNLCLSLVKKGQANPEEDPASLIPFTSRTTFTQDFIKYSESSFNKCLEAFKKIPGNTLTIDAGKHKVTPYLIAVLANALIDNPPLVIESIPFFKGKQEDYAQTVEKILVDLLAKNVKIVSIVTDNLRTQVSAVNHTNAQSFQKKSSNSEVRKTLWISCSCHTLALGLSDASKQSTYGDISRHVGQVAEFLRKKNITNLIGIRCPMTCPTRWTGLYDVSKWVLQNIDVISSSIIASLEKDTAYDFPLHIINGIFIDVPLLFCLLQPFAIATHMLEADHMAAANTIPIIHQAIERCKSNSSLLSTDEKMVEKIISCVENRIYNSQSGKILEFLYSLTPAGRSELRSVEGLVIYGNDDVTVEGINLSLGSESEQKILNNIEEYPTYLRKKGEDMNAAFEAYKGKLLNPATGTRLTEHDGTDTGDEYSISDDDDVLNFNEVTDEKIDDHQFSDEEYSSDSYSSDSDVEDLLHDEKMSNTTNGPLQDKVSTLKEIAELQGYSSTDNFDLVNSYIDWITADPSTFLIHQEPLLKGIKCWNYYANVDSLKKFANFVIPLMGIVSSEAMCERVFWQQKRILGDQSTRTTIRLEKAKLFFAVKH